MAVNHKLLQVFVSVAEQRSFRRAADDLGRSQSAVSMQIQQLEAQLGVALFHRTTRWVETTAEGARLLTYAQRAVRDWEDGLREIRDAAQLQRGTVSLACAPTLAASRLPQILATLQRSHPAIRVTLRELPAREMAKAIQDREFELGIGPNVDDFTDLDFLPLATDPIFAIAAAAFPLGTGSTIDLETLCKFPILLNTWSAQLRTMLERELAARRLTFDVKFEVLHVHTLIAFAREGLGVAILPKIAIPEVLSGAVQALPVGSPGMTRTIGIMTRRGYSSSPAASALQALVTELLRPHQADQCRSPKASDANYAASRNDELASPAAGRRGHGSERAQFGMTIPPLAKPATH